MSDEKLFNSKIDPIPPLRRDLQIIPVHENGDAFLYFQDQRGYATSNFALRREAGQLLSLFDGRKSIQDLESQLGSNVTPDDLLDFIQFLDRNRLLRSNFFERHSEQVESTYESASIHESVTAGGSYPADPEELREYLGEAFAKHRDDTVKAGSSTKALYAPHIDPRVALDSYVKAFAPIQNLRPKRVVILATSHYAGLYPDLYQDDPFILINKDFELPLATIRSDRNAIDQLLREDDDYGITTRDRAHRMEHSIELHLLFLSYLWEHNYKIIPFIVRGLDDLYYMENGQLDKQLQNFSTLLRNHYGDNDDTFFLISGDLAHFGKKFGDETPAATMFDEVKSFDQKFLEHGSSNERASMLSLIKEQYDPYRICGFPPLYTFLQAMPHLKGEVLSYDLWDERERDSAVTFGSILYD